MNQSEKEDALFKTVSAHEFFRCKESFDSFKLQLLLLPNDNTKRQRLNCYNTYVDFLSHLYEFYLGFIKRDAKFKQTGIYANYPAFKNLQRHEKFDVIFNEELEKLFRNRKNRLLHGYIDTLGHNIDFYNCKVPKEFGMHFRIMRNRKSHTDFRRASNDYVISLKDFFINYQKFILILYEESEWIWQVDENQFDWKAIDDFASEILV